MAERGRGARGRPDEPFGQLLRRYRGLRNITQEELAGRSGLSVEAVSALERGTRRTPRAGSVYLLADALNLDATERAAFETAAAGLTASPAHGLPQQLQGFSDPPLRVFLSHTADLRKYPSGGSFVAAAEAAVMRAGHAVADMEYFPARDSASADTCIAQVERAQVYVGIIGFRYGMPVRGRTDLSYTELEFETATRRGMPRLIFLLREGPMSQSDTEPAALGARQAKFRRRLLKQAGLTTAWVKSPSDLQLRLHQALIELSSMRDATVTATRTLPRDIATFMGREEEIERLLITVSDSMSDSNVMGVIAIDGMAGVGKTVFAVHVAHRLASQFPDGQLYLDLHGHTAGQRPAASEEALGSLLLTIGVARQAIPVGADARGALWRDRLTGRRMLILLDDVTGHEQVRPLLPAAAGCLVLITSRRRLSALEDIESLTLGTMTSAQAVVLFTRLLGPSARNVDPAAGTELVQMCGHLPLAISLLASRLRSHPTWTAAHLITVLEAAHDRLAAMQAEDRAVGAAFSLSYEALTADEQRLFRALLTFPWVAGWTSTGLRAVSEERSRRGGPDRRSGNPSATPWRFPEGTPVRSDGGDRRFYPPLRHTGRRLSGPPPNTLRWRSGRRVPSGG